jgi:hypothetical protein
MEMNTERHELDWSAFCYAAGEMNEAEAAAFELRLSDDQSAREALARAVELTQVVASAESLQPMVAVRSPSSQWSRRLGWMAIGSAASLLVALLWSGAGPWFAGSWRGGETVASGEQTRLADAWSQTRQELADGESELWYPKHASDSDAVIPTIEADELDSATPAWLTAAVESYPNEPSDPDSTPFDGERSEN